MAKGSGVAMSNTQQLQKRIKEIVKRKTKRNILMLVGISAIIFFLLFLLNKNSFGSFLNCLGNALASIFLGGIVFFIIIVVFTPFFNAHNADNKLIKELEDELYHSS